MDFFNKLKFEVINNREIKSEDNIQLPFEEYQDLVMSMLESN
jgi:hypothetical protein